jgi:uncharacterized protein YdhG (YjbR/CyaY superfamily)
VGERREAVVTAAPVDPSAGAAAVDAYLAGFDDERRAALEQVRASIHRGVTSSLGEPGAETVRYGIAAVALGGNDWFHFAGWKAHLAVYPVPTLPEPLQREIEPYRAAKDTARFLWKDPVPYALIERVAAAVAAERGA